MSVLQNKIDFAVIFRVRGANPNGDPLNGNRPRISYDGLGEVTDVCLKRKIRDRLLEGGHPIFVQANDRRVDDAKSLKDRAEKTLGKAAFSKKADKRDTAKKACEAWFDVRAFGQLFAFGKQDDGDGVSVAVRGPVTIHSAFTVNSITSDVQSDQIIKSVNAEGDSDVKKSSDTVGMKHWVKDAVYVTYGSMNPQLADRTGFSNEDAEAIKAVLPRLFENDASSARPEGSMEVLKVIWWKHPNKAGKYSSAKVHATLRNHVQPDGSYDPDAIRLEGLEVEEIDGF